MEGKAQEASVPASPPLMAYRLEGSTEGGVRFKAKNEMAWHRGYNEASFQGDVEIDYLNETHARGDEGVLTYRDDHGLDLLFLHGNVRLGVAPIPGGRSV